jgi:cardiolipin synthase C
MFRRDACVPPRRVRAGILPALCALITGGCASLPSLEGRVPSSALEDTSSTRLGRSVGVLEAGHPGESGIYALPAGLDAFAARALLANAADRSIDAQYYIWHGDRTGYLLFEALWHAAERGVRVRLLLDDNTTQGMDSAISALAARPNIEVRLYNPMVRRHARWTNYIGDFRRLNRRMHNKSFTVDNQVTVVGGRNIGDEYFDASDVAFADLDVAAVGPAVNAVSQQFDLYWNSASAYPAQALVGAGSPGAAAQLEEKFAATRADPASSSYLEALRKTNLVTELLDNRLPIEWAGARLVFDDPAKTLDTKQRTDELLLSRLLETTARPERQFDLVSPYFVPRKEGTRRLEALSAREVQVRVLTNSLASTDVTAVHAGYAKHRKALLRAGVELYELNRARSPHAKERNTHTASAASLHAKTFQSDGKVIFVGSFNFDPRSAKLNTEMGLVIDSAVLAGRLKAFFDTQVPTLAYRVELASEGTLRWVESTAEGPKIYDAEPYASAGRRVEADLLSILPIEGLL